MDLLNKFLNAMNTNKDGDGASFYGRYRWQLRALANRAPAKRRYLGVNSNYSAQQLGRLGEKV